MAVQISGNDITVPRDTSVTRNLTVGGVLTYEDVTNVDSVGLVTARSGIEIGARPGVAASISVDGNMIISGISTFGGDVQVPDKIIHSGDTNTAIRFPAADTITAETGGSERVRIDSSGNVLIGDSAGQIGKLSTLGTGNHISAIRHSTDTSSPNFLFAKYRGSRSSPAIIVNGDTLGDLAWYGYNGSSIIKAASVSAITSSTVDGSNMPTDLIFKTTAGNTNSEKVRITSTGLVGIGDNSPDRELVVKNASSNSTIKIEASNASTSQLFFSDTDAENVARISVFHGSGSDQNSMIFGTAGSNRLAITSAGKFGFNNISPSAEIELTFDSGGSAPSSGTAPEGIAISYGTSDGKNGGIWFSPGFGDDQGISGICGTRISGYDTDLRFYTNGTSSAAAFSERMRIDHNGKLAIGTNSPDSSYRTTIQESTSGHGVLVLDRTSNIDGNFRSFVSFERSGTAVGTILCSNSATQYNTSSDHRLKENVVTMSNATDRLKQLQPKRFNFILNPDTTVDGFLAHEVQSVVPEAISGTKDEVDSDNNPVYQGIDQSKLVPLLTAALQESVTEIESLKARLDAAGL